jgi:[ribosomal protein S18]-alanine N-acetyltransferase
MSALPQPRLVFRPMTAEDVAAVIVVEHRVYPFPWSRANFLDSLTAGYSCWVAELDGALLGYAVLMVAERDAHLLNLSIASPWQGKGYGRAFIEHLIDVARGHYADCLFLEVRPSNVVAHKLYASLGFAEVGMRKGYYPAEDGREDAIVMKLVL